MKRLLAASSLALLVACWGRESVPSRPPGTPAPEVSHYEAVRVGLAEHKAARTAQVVAMVDGEPIYGAEIEPRGSALRDARSLAVARQHYLDNAIETRLLGLEAARLGVALSREEVEALRREAPSPAEVARLAAQRGMTADSWWRDREERAVHAKLRARQLEVVGEVDETELRREFAANAWRYPRPPAVRLRHLAAPLSPASEREYAQQSRRLRDRAARLIDTRGVETLGTELGWLSYELGPDGFGDGLLADPALRQIAAGLEVGEVSAVVRGAHGLHVLACVERRPGGAANFDDVRDRVERVVRARRARDGLAAWKRDLYARYEVNVLLEPER